MRAAVLAAFAMVTLAGCGGDGPTQDVNAVAGSANDVAASAQPPETPARPAAASVVREENAAYSFVYTYPAEAAAIPALAKGLDADRAATLAALREEAGAALREAAADGFEHRQYAHETEWKVVTRTPRFLSLSSEAYAYTGGAHGMPSHGGLVWDRRTGREVTAANLFASPAAIAAAIRTPFCRGLDAERVKRRGGDWRPVAGSTDAFDTCPAIDELTLLPGSSDRRAIDRIGVVVEPYIAGPYAEGTYEVTVPVTAEVLRAVRPEYRDAFAAR